MTAINGNKIDPSNDPLQRERVNRYFEITRNKQIPFIEALEILNKEVPLRNAMFECCGFIFKSKEERWEEHRLKTECKFLGLNRERLYKKNPTDPDFPHNIIGYNYGCRCPDCKRAKSIYARTYRDNKAESKK